MEARRPHGGEDDKSMDETLDSHRERGFLLTWLERLRQPVEQTDDETETDLEIKKPKSTEEKEPRGRWERLFRRVFPQVVERPRRFNTEVAPSETEAAVAGRASEEELSETGALPAIEEDTPDEASRNVGEPSLEQHLHAEEDLSAADDALEAPAIDNSSEQEDLSDSSEISPPSVVPPAEHLVYVREQQPLAQQAEKRQPETIVRRDNKGVVAAVGLAGAEFLGRRRADRKIKKELKEIRKEAETQSRDIETLRQGRTAGEHKQAIKSEHRPLRAEQATVPTAAASEKVSETKVTQSIEKSSEIKKERVGKMRIESVESVPAQDEAKVEKTREERLPEAPKKVFEKVAIAAEHDLPIEKIYERRHEIKDEPTIVQASGAVPVGSILAQLNLSSGPVPASSSSRGADMNQSMRVKTSGHATPDTDLYKQAMKNGFWAAIILLIFLGIVGFSL